MSIITGTDSADTLQGTNVNDSLHGLGGNDQIFTGNGEDFADAGSGDDLINIILQTNSAGSIVHAYRAASGSKRLEGGAGADILSAGENNDTLMGGEGSDYLYGRSGQDVLEGGSGLDTLEGGDGNDTLIGGGENDQIFTGNGEDFADGGSGDDLINIILQTNSAGSIVHAYRTVTGSKRLEGGAGADILSAGEDNDILRGGEDADYLYGRSGDDVLEGGSGADTLDGGNGNDAMDGGEGADYLYGRAGEDVLEDGAGADVLDGGSGNDTYYISNNLTRIIDVEGENDKAYVSADFTDIPESIEKIVYLNGALPIPYWISALIYGLDTTIKNHVMDQRTAFYTFPKSAPSYDAEDKSLSHDSNTSYIGFTEQQQGRAQAAMQYIQSVIDLDLVATDTPYSADTLTFDFTRFIGTYTSAAGFATPPSPSFIGSDVHLNDRSSSSYLFLDNTFSSSALMHEIGHALGLKHPFEEVPVLPSSEDSYVWTVMSYHFDPVAYVLQYRPLDLAALHYLYGVNPSARPGDDIYVFNENSSNLIWDGNGKDTIDASSSSSQVTINLTPGHWGFKGAQKAQTITSAGQITVNFGSVIETLIGSSFDDHLSGNEEANTLRGGRGNDTIDGNRGVDTVLLNGPYKDYRFNQLNETLQVTDSVDERDGADTLSEVERLLFADGHYAFDLESNAGMAVKTLGVVLGAAAIKNAVFVGYGLSLLDEGLSYDALMSLSLETRLGTQASNIDVVHLLYSNVIGAAPSSEELQAFTSLLDSGTYSRAQFGIMAAESSFNLANIDIVGLRQSGIAYTEF